MILRLELPYQILNFKEAHREPNHIFDVMNHKYHNNIRWFLLYQNEYTYILS